MRDGLEPSTAAAVSDLLIAHTTVVTVCLAIMIWLGLLGRPTRATLVWTYAFSLALVGSYASLAAAVMDQDVLLHPIPIGLSFGVPALIWSGIRALRGQRGYVWTGIVQSLASVAILWGTTDLDIGFVVFRWLMLLSAVGAVFGAVLVLRGAFSGSRFGVPMVAGSAVLLLLGLVGVITGGVAATSEGAMLYVRAVVLATTCYIICATVSLLFLANRRPGARDVLDALDDFLPEQLMHAVVRERLVRASARGEQHWSFIDIRLDDVVDLREATGESAFATMVKRLEETVAIVFPAESDLCRVQPGHILIFVGQSSSAVREMVRTVLNTVGAPHADAPTSLRITASAGIVSVDLSADTYETLVTSADTAAEQAQQQGGDRWVRVGSRSSSA